MRIAFLLVRYPPSRPSPIFPQVVRLIQERGADVRVIHPDELATDLRQLTLDADLYVLKAGTETALSLAGALHALGAAILNPYPVSAMCRDKIVASKILHEAGVPAPSSYVASRPQELVPLLDEGPLIVKPYRGSQGKGVRVVEGRSDLLAYDFCVGPLFAQRYLRPDGLDRKVYCIGDEIFGVERTWPVRTYEDKVGKPFDVDRQLRELIANYYGMISLIDHNAGRIILALENLELLENTLIVYSTDHGDWLGDHGLILKGPMAYEGLLRVGLIFQGPGIPQGKIVQDPVSTLDLPATFADFAGVRFSTPHSRSLRNLIEGEASRDFAYSEWDLRPSRSGVDLDLRTVRTRRHKLTLELRSGAGELYDLYDDPHEMHNIFESSKAKAQLLDMIKSRPDDAIARLPQVGMA
jgi:hypothetical protein